MGTAMNLLTCLFILLVAIGNTRNIPNGSPPRLKFYPKSIDCFKTGDNVEMSCEAEGVGLEYYWTKDGQEFNLNGANIIHTPGTGTFEFHGIIPEDGGMYQCFVRNRNGTAMSDKATLKPTKPDVPHKRRSIETEHIATGQNIMLKCKIPDSYPPNVSSYTWQKKKDGHTSTSLHTDSRIVITKDHTLCIVNAKLSDRGEYFCEVLNQETGISQKGPVIVLNVTTGSEHQSKPVIISKPEETKVVLVGSDVTLECIFGGNPTPHVNWARHDLHSRRKNLSNYNTNLTIKKVRMQDAGNYTCTGKNKIGQTSYSVTVVVQKKPQFKSNQSQPQDISVIEGDTARFECKTDAIPEAKVQWFRNAEPLDADNLEARMTLSDNGTVLTIIDVCLDCNNGRSDSMVIQCNASNIHGHMFAQGTLTVITDPSNPDSLQSDGVRSMVSLSTIMVLFLLIFWL